MYTQYSHLDSIKKAFHNLQPHLADHHKEEIQNVLHQSIGHVNSIDPSFATYAEMFKEDF
ncbi:hypothetical protein AWM68_07355 [Fictibacillus phosphorivorans]|uniref:Uncharacterized protein n=1 Tax=Fictibacillus phosphorivorans TaxID=1221500 RepID=A0A163R4K4_9BACL|nr:hypothetical protein [Fictibacillus phosphorivorans]KZE66181.1 hypothetical protein AWM68_07355 [Fictibacillus phosphorivorans]